MPMRSMLLWPPTGSARLLPAAIRSDSDVIGDHQWSVSGREVKINRALAGTAGLGAQPQGS